MSFSRSGSTAPAFSFPIGYGSFTDVNASNAVFTSNVYSSFYHGDGGLLSNVISSISGSLPNLVVSNSLTTTNVYASNIADQTGTFGTTGQVLTKAVAGTLWAAPAISSQWTTGTGNIYYLSNVGIGTSAVSSNLVVVGNAYVSNALTTTNVYASNIADQTGTFGTTGQVLTKAVAGTLWAAPAISSQWTTGTGNIYYLSNVGIGTSAVSSNLVVVGNAYVSNALTTTNVYASNIADQTGTFGTTGQVLTKADAGTLWAAAGGGSSQWTGTVGTPIYYVPQVGIGSSTTPTSNLTVTGNVYVSNALTTANIFVTGNVNVQGISNLYVANIATANVSTLNVSSILGQTGYVGIGIMTASSYNLQVAGTIGASGDITAFYSDERLKTKTGTLTGALDKVCSLDTFTYVNNELAQSFGFKDTKERLGLSAQQVQKVAPQTVSPAPFDAENQSGQNYLTVQYEKLVPLLIEALKEERAARLALEEKLGLK